MEGATFLPLPLGLRITEVCQEETSLLIKVLSERVSACCPLCGHSSDVVHSRYQRRLKDIPSGGQAICLQLTVHKFFCHNPQCQRKIFTERLPTFVEPWAQMTLRLTAAVQAIGLSTSGSLGARFAARLGIATSWMTILRRMMALPTPSPGAVTVLGIDDFSFKRGRKFGTILVDLDLHQVIGVLAERSSQTSADWMRAHPEITYVSRDRGKDYAQGASEGAPQAVSPKSRKTYGILTFTVRTRNWRGYLSNSHWQFGLHSSSEHFRKSASYPKCFPRLDSPALLVYTTTNS